MPKNTKKNSSWFKGPSFLLLSETNRPKMPLEKDKIIDVTPLFINKHEIKSKVTSKAHAPSEKFLILINYYSNFHRLIRAICYIFRATRACLIKKIKKAFFELGIVSAVRS